MHEAAPADLELLNTGIGNIQRPVLAIATATTISITTVIHTANS